MIAATSSNPFLGLSTVAGSAFADVSIAITIICAMLLGVMIINRIVETAGGEHVDFGIDDDDRPDL